MKPLFGILAGAMVGLAGPAFAAGPVISVGELGPHTCVSRPDLEDALSRSGLAVGSSAAVSGAERVQVDVAGAPDQLVVSLHDGGPTSEERLAPATCETATDVVAAFVTSALAPPPVVAVPAPVPEPPPAPPARAIDASLRDGLAKRGVSLGREEAVLDLAEDDSGVWHAKLDDPRARSCSRTVALGHFADLSPERRAAATNILLRALENYRMCAAEARRKRASILADALEQAHGHTRSAGYGVDSAVLILEGGLVLFEGTRQGSYGYLGFSSSRDALATAGGGLWVAGGVAGLLAPADHRQGVFEASLLAGAGALWMAGAMMHGSGPPMFGIVPTRGRDEPGYSRVALAAASFSTAGLVALRTALAPPPLRRLEAAYRETRTDEQQGRVSSRRMAEMEADLSRLDPPIPYLVQYSPLIVGGVVAMIPAFTDGFGSAGRNFVAIYGATYALFGAIGVLPWSPFRDYQKSLEGAGIHDVALGMGPGDGLSVSLSGRF